ncbi:MAG: aminotransferase, partial [Pseudomonadota bacterium]
MSYSNAPWPVYEDDEVAAVEAVLRSGKVNYWTGSVSRDFEKDYAAYVGVPHA